MSTPISGIVNRTGVDLVRAADEILTGAVALGSSAWLLGGRDAVLVLLGTIEVSAALVLPEQAETMAVASSATTAIDRLGW